MGDLLGYRDLFRRPCDVVVAPLKRPPGPVDGRGFAPGWRYVDLRLRAVAGVRGGDSMNDSALASFSCHQREISCFRKYSICWVGLLFSISQIICSLSRKEVSRLSATLSLFLMSWFFLLTLDRYQKSFFKAIVLLTIGDIGLIWSIR